MSPLSIKFSPLFLWYSEDMSTKNTSAQEIIARLKKAYPNPRIALTFSNFWELLVAVILSAQCTDKKVNEVTQKLFKKYPKLEDYVSASQSEFESDIKSTGFYRAKTKNILASAKLIKTKFKGVIPKTMAELTALPGVARKTANVVLGNAYGVVEGIAVDTHVLRISQRLRLVNVAKIGGKKKMLFKKAGREVVDYIKDADPVKVETELMKVIPKSEWFNLTYRIIDHGRAVCKAQNPQCSECTLKELCPASRV